MGNVGVTTPVGDSVPKVDKEVAVGEDIEFQRKWWKFEKIVWSIFVLILVLAIAGVFGRGPAARARKVSPDGIVTLKYDRIQRTGTPSDLDIALGAEAIRGGEVHIFLSESVITKLGAQRISPQPEKSVVGNGGVTYTFPATQAPANIVVSMQPSGPGAFPFQVSLPDTGSQLTQKIVVVP